MNTNRAPTPPSHPSTQSSALLMYAVGHAIQAGVNQEVFTACDTPSQFDRIDMLVLTDAARTLKTMGPRRGDSRCREECEGGVPWGGERVEGY